MCVLSVVYVYDVRAYVIVLYVMLCHVCICYCICVCCVLRHCVCVMVFTCVGCVVLLYRCMCKVGHVITWWFVVLYMIVGYVQVLCCVLYVL